MPDEADEVASAVLREFDRLPRKRKPIVRDNGLHEWVPLSGIVANVAGSYQCLSLATGMKCLPAQKLPQADGVGLHDWHAEVLAIRSFNHLVLGECQNLALGQGPSAFIRPRTDAEMQQRAEQLYAWKEDVTLHMYCSEAPCGDASMELIMAAQEDASPWDLSPGIDGQDARSVIHALPGRAYFSRLGVVRRKPARGDAPQSLSKSCSDKIARKQCTSLLSSIVTLFVSPTNVYLESLVLPLSQHSAVACERAFSARGRMGSLVDRTWPGGYVFKPFQVKRTSREFYFSKRAVAARAGEAGASNNALLWTMHGTEESLTGGVLQGRRPFHVRGASLVSRRGMWAQAIVIANMAQPHSLETSRTLAAATYRHLKASTLLEQRRRVKEDVHSVALPGWPRNTGDEQFSLS